MLLGVFLNSFAVILGGCIGLLLGRGLSDRISETIMNGLALCVLLIGISGSLEGENVLLVILAVVLGALCGEGFDLEGRIERRVKKLQVDSQIVQGFITASLLFCVGAMAIIGSLQSGLSGTHEILMAKSLLDGTAAFVLASTLGVGVILAVIPLFFYQGGLVVLSGIIEPYLTSEMIQELTCVGSLLIIGIALNMLKVTDLKIMNYVPALFVIVLLCLFK